MSFPPVSATSRSSLPFHGLIGSGLIGWDAFDRTSWSGSSFYFFTECQRQGLLSGTSGGEVGGWRKLLLLGLRYHPNKPLWRMKYYLDPRYRRALTKVLAPKIRSLPTGRALLQIGALFDAPSVAAGQRSCFSYHDGNLAMRLRSPFGSLGLSERDNQKALDYERDLYSRIDMIFTMSEYLRRSFLDDFGVPSAKVINIGAGANLDTLPAADGDKAYGSQQLLFIGVDFERKGGMILLESFAKARAAFPKAVLHVVGPKSAPPPGFSLEGVVWHGFLSKDDPDQSVKLQELFRVCSLFILPSLYEPFGIAPAEAMLHGLPAIVTGDWALAETVLNGKTGRHVRAGDVTDLASVIKEMLADSGQIRALGRQAHLHAMGQFTWESVVKRLRAALAEFSAQHLQGRGVASTL